MLTALAICTTFAQSSAEDAIPPDQVHFFEQNIRPILQGRCYKCHSGEATELHANLYLDSRPGWQQGGDSGIAIVPGGPDESLVLQVLAV